MTPTHVRLGVDATPLLGRRTGVGVYAAHLLAALADTGEFDITATAFTTRGGGALPAAVPAGVTVRHRPVPATLLRQAWGRGGWPPVEWLCGGVDVFHATNFVLPPARRARGVVTVHDLAYLRHADTVARATLDYRTLVPRSIERAQVVCAPSHAVAAEIAAEYAVEADRLVVTSPGVDAAWFDAAPPSAALAARLGLPRDAPYLLAVGTLEPRKNLDVVLDAHEAAWRDGLTAPLVVVGAAGWGAPPSLADRPAGSLVVTGYLDDAELRAVTAGAAGLVFPSRYEGFGIPPLEALAAGVPVVVSDLPVTREVLGDAAGYVDASDRAAWADAMLRLARATPGEAEPARGRARAGRYTWAGCAAAATAAYRLAWERPPRH